MCHLAVVTSDFDSPRLQVHQHIQPPSIVSSRIMWSRICDPARLQTCDRCLQSMETKAQSVPLQDMSRLPTFGAHFVTKMKVIGAWTWEGAIDFLVTVDLWNAIIEGPSILGKPPPVVPVGISYNRLGDLFLSLLSIAVIGPISMVFCICHSVLEYGRSWRKYEWWNKIQKLKGMFLDWLGF